MLYIIGEHAFTFYVHSNVTFKKMNDYLNQNLARNLTRFYSDELKRPTNHKANTKDYYGRVHTGSAGY